jgi:hypothetical protein
MTSKYKPEPKDKRKRVFLKKLYKVPVLIALGSLIKPVKGDFGSPPSDPGGW